MALILARHGETALNVARVVQPADTALSARGARQAEALAERLAREFRVAAIVTSDLARAHQTAERVGLRLARSVEVDACWRERDFGALRGRAYDSLGFDPLVMREAPEGGESLAQFEARVAGAYAAIAARAASFGPERDLLVVTHGLVLRALLERHLTVAQCASDARSPANTSLTTIDVMDRPGRVLQWACAAHLEDRSEPGAIVGI